MMMLRLGKLYRQYIGRYGMNRLEGKVALISGAAKGQGAEEVALFAAEGAQVILEIY